MLSRVLYCGSSKVVIVCEYHWRMFGMQKIGEYAFVSLDVIAEFQLQSAVIERFYFFGTQRITQMIELKDLDYCSLCKKRR